MLAILAHVLGDMGLAVTSLWTWVSPMIHCFPPVSIPPEWLSYAWISLMLAAFLGNLIGALLRRRD